MFGRNLKLAIVGSVVFGLWGCNYSRRKGPGGGEGELHILDRALDSKARAILSERCLRCHGPGSARGQFDSVADTARMVREGWIRVGNPETSPLFRTLRAGFMPPGEPLASEELEVLKSWISTALFVSGSEETGAFVFDEGASDLTRRAVTLFNTQCTPCHNPRFGEKTGAGILDMRDPARMVAAGLIYPGRSGFSPLFQTILHAQEGKAPFEALAEGDVEMVRKWIDTDLTDAVRPLVGNVVLPMEPAYGSIRANLLLTRCLLCHGGAGGIAGGVDLSTYEGVQKSVVKGDAGRSPLYEAVRSGRMPERYLPLSDRELRVLEVWIGAGAPEN